MLSLAKLRSFEPSDLVSIGNAANILNVTRPTIYRWMDDKSLDYVRDDMSGRTFVVRQDVEAMKADMDAAEANDRGLNLSTRWRATLHYGAPALLGGGGIEISRRAYRHEVRSDWRRAFSGRGWAARWYTSPL